MNLAALTTALQAIEPGAAALQAAARRGVQASASVGSQFLGMLAGNTNSAVGDVTKAAATDMTASGQATTDGLDSASSQASLKGLDSRARAFGQKLMAWIRQHTSAGSAFNTSSSSSDTLGTGDSRTGDSRTGDSRTGASNTDVTILLSLDQFDQPQVHVDGQRSDEITQLMQNDPEWRHEFRQLALDRIEQSTAEFDGASGHSWRSQSAYSQNLVILQRSDSTIDTHWQ